ncbi:antirestriction protein ArdA [Bacteroidales bacterium OttesenSCG-928-K03]|nr:antirestriction protein ArdA [Odoribacter sp. OttesenSCG-928-L07]MDL2239920.1 antirestriction protein ArdA [Bacteroidales bacterium OttesenSCG-928-L14]MDL2240163.1 antirestriction protein ArdA [Bacteroidales bacterium OttesenSCG-928-K22]MDL2242482.1 antirestriction protein ArdA [Bacteroidales bacterium OttesenSCG-928-K03]
MNAIDLNEARVYVGTYAKYNNYSNYGKWFELSEFSNKDEFIRACAEFHNDDDDPEFMFQAWTNIPEDLICESWLSDKFFDIKDTLNDLSPDEQEPFLIWCNNGTHNLHTNDINELIASFRDDFQGKYKDEEDYAYSIIEECYNLPQLALDYFDYEKFAYDLFLGDCWFENGFVFRIS